MSDTLYLGDCLDVLPTLADASVDSVVTDPPYGLSFMNKHWDHQVPDEAVWRECLRVLKPGGHLLAFAGTRTQHRMAVRIEDAGFEIRDMIAWVYGSGFPKSKSLPGGFGSALKPALEPITVARKPLTGSLEGNFAAHGTGGLNINASRIATGDKLGGGAESPTTAMWEKHEGWQRPWMADADARERHAATVRANVERAEALGRWPANLIHDGSDEVLERFPAEAGGAALVRGTESSRPGVNAFGNYGRVPSAFHGDRGSAARFYYCAKTSPAERGEGNDHPTVKPVDLMRYLCQLVTPKGGTVLDPFMGSGSTGVAAVLGGFGFIGIEREAAYHEIAVRRLQAAHTEVRMRMGSIWDD